MIHLLRFEWLNSGAKMPSTQRPSRLGILEVEDLRIVDKDGSTLARLGRDKLGSFGLAIGETASGDSMLTLSVTTRGEPCIEMRDRQGNCRAALSVIGSTGEVVFGLLDESQRARAQITVSPEGQSSIGLFDAGMKMKIAMTDFETESVSLPGLLTSFDKNGNAVWQSPRKRSGAKQCRTEQTFNIAFG